MMIAFGVHAKIRIGKFCQWCYFDVINLDGYDPILSQSAIPQGETTKS